MIDTRIVGIPVIQNQQEFVIGVFTISQILKFTNFTHRLIVSYDEQNLPVYNPAIQRFVEGSMVEKIADFLIDDPEATFPTNIVLHIPIQVIEKQIVHDSKLEEFRFLEIFISDVVFNEVKRDKEKSGTGDIFINIIDGQHRIRGIEVAIERLTRDIMLINQTLLTNPNSESQKENLSKYQQRLTTLLNIELVVSFFVDKSLEYQAMIFATINRTQKRVSESLVYSLFGLTKNSSPQKTALQIVLELNANKKSPFYNRIKLYGGSYDTHQSPPLSQASMVKSIIELISENLHREAERDRFKKRSELHKRSPSSSKVLPFRKYYASNEDTKISDIFYAFFTAVKDTLTDKDGNSYWEFEPDRMKPTNILHTTVGYQALLNLLIDILEDLDEKKRFNVQTYKPILEKIKTLNFEDTSRYPFTSISRTILFLDMSLKIWPPEGMYDPRLKKLEEALDKTL